MPLQNDFTVKLPKNTCFDKVQLIPMNEQVIKHQAISAYSETVTLNWGHDINSGIYSQIEIGV